MEWFSSGILISIGLPAFCPNGVFECPYRDQHAGQFRKKRSVPALLFAQVPVFCSFVIFKQYTIKSVTKIGNLVRFMMPGNVGNSSLNIEKQKEVFQIP
jgi:hypothetical protein